MKTMKKQGHTRPCHGNNITINRLKRPNPQLINDYGVARIGIFDSYSRGENRDGSNIDLLVEFERLVNLLKFSHLKRYLSTQLGIEVDLITPGALKPLIKDNILKGVVCI
jgi:uncharacterized protein